MTPPGPTEIARLLDSPAPDDRAALLRLSRDAPLAYGWWQGWKRLLKAAEGRADPELLGALLGRLDAAPWPATGPSALRANPALIDGVGRLVVSGDRAYALRGGYGRGDNVRAFDVSDPCAPVQTAGQSVPSATALLLRGPHAWVFSSRGYRERGLLQAFDTSDPSRLPEVGTAGSSLISQAVVTEDRTGDRLFMLISQSYGEATGLSVALLPDEGLPDKGGFLAFSNPVSLAAEGTAAAVLWRQNYYAPMQMTWVDASDPMQPRPLPALDAPDTQGWAVSGRHVFLAVGTERYRYGQSTQARTGLRVVGQAAGFLEAVGLKPAKPVEVGFLELGNARAVAVEGRYAFVAAGRSGSRKNGDFRPGGLRVVDIADPQRPRLVGSLDGLDVQTVTVSGGRAFVGVGSDVSSLYGYQAATPRTVRIVDVSDPARPVLLGTPASRRTLGYLKRRARRLLRHLADTDPAAYAVLAFETLRQSGRGQESLDLARQWVAADILYGGTRRATQAGHGRGGYHLAPRALSLRTRDERRPDAWDARPDLAAALLALPDLPWQTHEAAAKMLRAQRRRLPPLPEPALTRFFGSPSLLLVASAARQALMRVVSGTPIDPALAADAYFFAGAGARRGLADALAAQSRPDWWRPNLARHLFTRAVAPSASGRLSRRRVGALLYAIDLSPEAIPASDIRPVFALLLAADRPPLTAWALGSLRRVAPSDAAAWLESLSGMAGTAQEPALAALRAGLAGQPFGYADAWALIQSDNAWVRAQGWTLLARSTTDTPTLARVWGELMDAGEATPALETAFASADALELLRRADLDGEALNARLESRPFLVRLLPPAAFALVARAVPGAVLVRLIGFLPDAQWQAVRSEMLQTLGASGRLAAFWHAAWPILSDGNDPALRARLLGDTSVAGSFLAVDDPAFLETTTDPLFDDLLARWSDAHAGLFPRDSPLLLVAATRPLPAVRRWALAQVRRLGLGLPFALRLLESDLPESAAVGQGYFEALPPADPAEMDHALALCDSPQAAVRAWGRGYAERRWDTLPRAALLRRLAENPDPQTQAFLAAKLNTDAPADAPDPDAVRAFDREVLRARNRGRRAKELVKSRRDRPAAPEAALDAPTLREIARSHTPRDAEWALGQLARLALAGEEVDGLALDGVAGV